MQMDKATTSVCSSRNSEMPEETGMQQIASELQALKRLYGLLHKGSADENLDETSKALMLKMLDDATQQALLKQAKMLPGSLMSPVLERKLSIRSDLRTLNAEPRQRLSPIASPSPSPSLLAAGERPSRLNPQYSTVSSRPGGGHVDGHRQAAEEPLLARLASCRSSRTTASALPPRHRPGGAEQRNSGLSLYRLPVVAATSQHGTVAATSQHGTVAGSNRCAGRRDMRRHGSSRGGRSSLPEGSSSSRGQHSVSREVSLGQARQRVRGTVSSTRRFGRLDSGLPLSVASRRGSERAGRRDASPEQSSSSNTVATIRSRIRPNQDHKEHRLRRQAEEEKEESTPRRGSTDTDASVSASTDHGDRSSPEGSSRRGSVSRELSLGRARLHGRGTTSRDVGGGDGSCSTRRFGRSGSGLSLGLASLRGSTRAGRGVASRERHTSSNTKASRTRLKPSQDIKERSLRRAEVEGESPRWRGRTDASVCSGGRLPRRALKRIDSGSMYMSRSSRNSSHAAISCPSTSPTVSPEPSTYAASYSPPPVSRRGMEPPGSRRGIPAPAPASWRGMAPPPPPVSMRGVAPPPVYAPRATRSMRRRRRLEVLEKRVGRLRMLKSKIAMVFHHRHDHHHHFGRGGQEEGPSSRAIPGEHDRGSPWGFLGEMFHHRTERRGKEKTTSRMVIGGAPPAKKRGGGGGNIHALFDAVRRHLRDKRRKPATASVKMRRTANRSRTLAKKMHWWQRLKQRRGRKEVAAGRPRRRLGLGKF
ncbi:unnamed protein product [Urochloa decumbens]|uniref:Uncharacterized protein n=1 Tax=Urochloa decumbens TaxID=240449 RepID=A0ABC9F574_9POAL